MQDKLIYFKVSVWVFFLGVDKVGELNRNGSVYRLVCKGIDMYYVICYCI